MAVNGQFVSELEAAIQKLKDEKVYKRLNYLDSPQSAYVEMEGRGRVLVRPSGTEPLVRVMVEAETEEQARADVRHRLPSYTKYIRQILPVNVPVDLSDAEGRALAGLIMLDTYVPDEQERFEAFAAVENIPSIARKAEFCFKWIDSIYEMRELRTREQRRAFLLNVICFAACIEGLFFYPASVQERVIAMGKANRAQGI